MITFNIKKRSDDGRWQNLSIGHFAGKKLGQVLLEMDGKEYVAEYHLDNKRCFLCGTEHWLQRMKEKGPAVTFGYAVARLKDTRPELLDEILPVDIASEFGGEVEEMKFGEGV